MHRLLLSSCISALVLSGCSIDLSVDGDPQIACADDSDCPPGLVCSDALGVCISEEASRRGLLELADISVTPRARAGTTLYARFRLAEPLPLEPEVELRSGLSFSFIRDASSTELEHVYRYEVLGNEGHGDWPVFVSYVDPSGVVMDTLLGQVELDFVAPSLAGAVARTAAIIGRDQSVRFTFSASEPLGPSPRVWLQLTTIGTRELSLTSAGTGNSYTFEYATIGDELDGPADLLVDLEDLAGNAGDELEPAAVTLDLTGPSVVPLTDSVELIPALDNPIRLPSAACAGTVVRVVFSLSEATVAPPTVTGVLTSDTGTAVVTFANLPSAGVTHAAEYAVTATGSDPTEDLRVRIDATDLYNNDAVILLDLPTGSFRIDTLPPPPPALDVEGRVTYTRVPWGSEATGGLPFFEVDGGGDAVENDAWAVAYDGPRIRAANEIGRARADQLGAFTGLDLGGADRTRVYLAAVDDAGNVSDVLGVHGGDERADPIRDVLWTASLIGRLPGSSVENPHVVWTLTGTVASRAQRSTQLTEPSLAGALDAIDGAAVSTRGRWLWRERHAVTANPTPREGPGIAYDTARGRVVLFGGNVSATSGSCDGTGLLYCSETWEWDGTRWFNPQPPFPRPSPRYDPAMAYDSRRGRVLLFGGQDAGYGYRLNDLWAWDGAAWTELTPAVSPPGRVWHAIAYDSARDRLVLFGGWGSVEEPECDDPALENFMDPGTCDDTWEFDGELWTEVSIGSGPVRRYLHGLAYDSRRQRVVLFGGQGNDPNPATGSLSRSDTWEWSGENWIERTPASGNAPARVEHALAFAPDLGRVLMFGGADDFGVLSEEVWAWDGSTWSLVAPSGASITGRRQHDITYDAARSALFVFGGSDPGGTQQGAWILRQNRWADATTGTSFSGRSTVAAAYDAGRNQVLLFGGYRFPVTCSGPLGTCDDTWSWNGYAWSNVTPSTAGPGGRRLHGMVYDATRGRTVLISGSGSSTLDDVWEWDAFAGCDASDGACWQDRTPASTPGPLRSFAAAFDSRRHRTVVFGGHDGTTITDETWEYDGSAWFQRSPASSPPPRQGAAMAYDPVRERTVLFGGTVGATGYLDDTWEWDWEAWTEVTPPAPSPAARTGHSLVWSEARQRILLYGGSIDLAVCPTDPAACCNGLFDLCDDTWEWDGASWRKLEVDGAPLRRSSHAAAYHPLRKTVVVAGGKTDRESFAGDTWELDTSADSRPAVSVQIDWNAADASTEDVRDVSLRAVAGGTGYLVRRQANDIAVAGARLLAWDVRRSGWVELDAHGAVGFADLSRSTADPAGAAALIGADGTLQLRIEPRAGAGNAAQEPEIDLDYVEASVRYRTGTVPVCGNGVLEMGETCDDGGTTAGDGCGATCAAEGACGDGVTEGAEACDDGQANDDGSADACRTDCTRPRCSDGVVDTGEDCDDGNTFDDANGCDATCSANAVCGDGVVQPLFEACEPPGTATCDATCMAIEPCCTDSAVPGCAPPGSKAVEGCVCAIEPRCCVLYWAPVCVSLITTGGCGVCP